MRMLVVVGVLVVGGLSSSPARAQFEGGLAYDVQGDAGMSAGPASGLAMVWLSPAGARIEYPEPAQGSSLAGRVVTMWRRDEPDRLYVLDEARQSYVTRDVDGEDAPEVTYRVTRLGPTTVGGYACERARITSRERGSQEVCVTRDLGSLPVSLFSDRPGIALWNQLRRAGLSGVPVSWKGPDTGFSMVLVHAERLPIPPSYLEVPTGFRQTGVEGQVASSTELREMEAGVAELRKRMGGG